MTEPEAARVDAQEIKTAVAHQDAASAPLAEAPFVNLADPARALGAGRPPGGQPARADLRGRPRRAVERLALAALATGSTTSTRSSRS